MSVNRLSVYTIAGLAAVALAFVVGYRTGEPDADDVAALCRPYEAAAVERAKAEAIEKSVETAKTAVENGNKLLDEYEKAERQIETEFNRAVGGGADDSRRIDERLCRAVVDTYNSVVALHPGAADNAVRVPCESPDGRGDD